MAADDFNSLGGYSVGIPPLPVIDANGNVVTNVLVTSGNVAAANIYGGNYFYANGRPFNAGGFPVGPNTSIQYNNNTEFDGSANFTFDNTTELVTIPNLNITGLSNLGPVGNVTITGGASGYALTTDGNGTLYWTPPGSGTSGISKGTSNLIIPISNGNIVAGVSGTANVLTITSTGLITTGNVTATEFIGNIASAGTVTVNAQPNITSVGTLTSLNVSDTVNAPTIVGNLTGSANTVRDGYQPNITSIGTLIDLNVDGNISAGNVTATEFFGNIACAFTANTVLDNAQPNITSVGTLINVSVAGNTITQNLLANSLVRGTTVTALDQLNTANLSSNGLATIARVNITNTANLGSISNITITGGTSGQILSTDGAGNLSWTNDTTTYGNSNVVSLLSNFGSNIITTTGNITAGNLIGNGSRLTSLTGANVTGYVPNANHANVADVANNVSGANVSGDVAGADHANIADVANSVSSANIVGQVANALVAGTVYTNAQPNITSVGTLTGLAVSGTTNLGSVGNVVITGGSSGYVLQTNGSGGLSWVGISSSSISNGNSNVNIPSSNGNVNISAFGNANVLVVTGTGVNISGNLNVPSGIISGNGNGISSIIGANVSGQVNYAAVANSVAGANVSGQVNYAAIANSVAGANVSGQVANALVAGTVYTNAQPNITSVGTLTSLSVSGNITGANITGNHYGAGNNLSNIQGSNVTGAVGLATYATTANNVAGINVSGQVNYAAVANSVAGANVSGQVNYAATANSVAGANVSGQVNYAATANAVAGANVSGQVNYAAVANSVAGANVSGQVANALVAGTVYTNAQPNITSVGSLTGLTVTGTTNLGAIGNVKVTGGTNGQVMSTDGSGNLSFVTISTSTLTNGNSNINVLANSNITFSSTGNANVLVISGSGANVTGCVNVSGNVTASNFIGNVVGNISGNIVIPGSNTGVVFNDQGNANTNTAFTFNKASNLVTITGNANVGNLNSSGLVASANLSVTGNANLGNLGTTNLVATGAGSFGANVNMATNWINNVGYPSLSTDAATKAYVDTMVSSGIAYHQPVAVATTTTLATATGGTTAYVQPNGAGNGIGAYISTTGTYLNIDGANVQTIGTRILVKDESNASWNGVYTYANTTAIIRSTDTDEYGPDSTEQLSINDFFFTSGGIVNEGVGFIVSAPAGTITFGTSNIAFSIFTTAQVYNAGTGIDITGTVISVANTTVSPGSYGDGDRIPSYTVNQQGQLTAASNTVITANAANLSGTTLASGVVNSSLTNVGSLTGLTVSNSAGTVNFITTANVSLGAVANVHISGGSSGYYLQTDGSGNLSWVAISASSISNGNSNVSIPSSNGNVNISANGNANILVVTGTGANINGTLNTTGLVTISNTSGGATAIAMGSPTQGNLISNAVTLTTSSSVSNAIAQLNVVLGKLVPVSPPNFPASQTLSVQSLSTYRMTNYVQTDNTPGANKSVAGGTTVSTVLRTGTYTTNSITTAGPGDAGTISTQLNGSNAGGRTLTALLDGNGTYSNLTIFNNYDYHSANSSIPAGFWSVFSANASGTVTQGWNEVYIADSVATNTNTSSWFYDSSNPGTPAFSTLTISPPGSPSYTYSSTVPHYNNTNIFTITANVNKLSGNMYPTSDNFVTGTSGGAFGTPGNVTYAAAGVTTPLAQNLYVSSGNASISTTSTIISGFGASSTGPSLSSNNSYASNTQSFTATLAANVLYKTGTTSSATVLEEANVYVGSTIGSGSGLAYRIVNPGSADTPVYTGSEAAFNSQSSTLQTYDSTIVANVLKHDQTNYSTGYLPAGPNLSSGRTGAQYFTFKIVRTSVSKFDVKWTGNIAGLWVALPGSTIDSTSSANGWIDMSVAYAGAGIPGVNSPGNGSNGCALGGVAPLNSAQTNKSVTATFGTISSSSTVTNEIYIRIKLTSGQSVTALSLQTASN